MKIQFSIPKIFKNFDIYRIENVVSSFINVIKERKRRRFFEQINRNNMFMLKYLPDFSPGNPEILKSFKKKFPFVFSNENYGRQIISQLNMQYPEYLEKLQSKSREILRNKFQIFNKTFSFLEEKDWFFSFNDSKFWPLKRSEKIQYTSQNRIADIKFTWELNRHEYLVTLAITYYITSDENYAKKVIDLLYIWIKGNPTNFGPNWISPLENSIRILFWMLSLLLIKNSKELSMEKYNTIIKSLFKQVTFIKLFENLNTYNHCIAEQFGIIFFSYFFRNYPKINKWFKRSSQILMKQFDRQFLEEGVHIELSANYHHFTFGFYLYLYLITPELFNKKRIEKMRKIANFLDQLVAPDGKLIQIGDSDNASIIPDGFIDSNKFKEILNLSAVLLGDVKLNNWIQKIPPLLYFFIPFEEINSKFEKIKKINENISYYPHSGYFFGHSDQNDVFNYIFYNMAGFGPKMAGHSHSDISNIILYYDNKPILVDSGTFEYNGSLEERNHFRGSQAHNVLTMNERNQATILGSFSWGNKPKVEHSIKDERARYRLFVTYKMNSNFIVRRTVFLSKNCKSVKIKDIIIPSGKTPNKIQEINLNLHFSPHCKLLVKDNWVEIDEQLIFTFKTFTQNLDIKIQKGFRSEIYGERYPIEVLNLRCLHNFNLSKKFQLISYLKVKQDLQ